MKIKQYLILTEIFQLIDDINSLFQALTELKKQGFLSTELLNSYSQTIQKDLNDLTKKVLKLL